MPWPALPCLCTEQCSAVSWYVRVVMIAGCVRHASCVVQFVQSFDENGVAAQSRTVRLLLDAINDMFALPTSAERARMLVQVGVVVCHAGCDMT